MLFYLYLTAHQNVPMKDNAIGHNIGLRLCV